MKYKIGDKVRVREDLKIDDKYGGCLFARGMKRFKGKEVTITNTLDNYNRYLIEGYKWTDEMFEDVESGVLMKFKIGDKVRVRDDLEVGQVYDGCEFVIEMEEFRGKIMTIEKAYCSSYHLHGGGTWHFNDEMLEDVESGVMIKIYVDGNIVAAQKDDKVGVARCSPGDEFDIFVGAKLAIERLEEKCKPYGWLTYGIGYYYPSLTRKTLYDNLKYNGDEFDERLKNRGLIFRTREEAVEMAKKMLAVLK